MTTTITIIDYGMSNLRSVAKAFEAIGCTTLTTSDPGALTQSEAIVLPGDGAFAAGMKQLTQRRLIEPLREAVLERQVPFLGICLGMQLLARVGLEHGRWDGLGWLDAEVRLLKAQAMGLKIPHIGWEEVRSVANSVLLRDLPGEPVFYFVHSYGMECTDQGVVKGTCRYGEPFAAVLEKDNVFATQFHPEKSQRVGLQLLRNFVAYQQESLCRKPVLSQRSS